MSLVPRKKIKWLLALVVIFAAVSLCARGWANSSVETYLDQGAPSQDMVPLGPVKPGTITLDDVLKAHKPPKPLAAPGKPASPATAPLLTPPAKESSTSSMMMQGLKSVLQESGTPLKTPSPSAPVLKPPTLAKAPMTPPAATGAPTAITYAPGQAPKDLTTGTPAPAAPKTETPEAKTSTASTEGCAPKVSSWVKNCADAGYPESFTGEIHGETRANCPDGELKDVWVSNTCAPPEGEEKETAQPMPLSAPDTMKPAVKPESPAEMHPETHIAVQAPEATLAAGDASCGPANGLAIDAKPTGDLCNAGMPSEVVGSGPWRWSCAGTNGGMTVSCAAPKAAEKPAQVATSAPKSTATVAMNIEDGQCGSSNGASFENPPDINLCVKGMASRVNGKGPWTWACSGLNGGGAISCMAARKTDGVCGGSNGKGADTMPMSELCSEGIASAVTGEGPWNWTCSGLYGGQAATCSAAPKQDAICGSAVRMGHREAPQDGLCSIGKVSSVSGSGPWTWNCEGSNGGATVECAAPISVNGQCGSSNGTAVAEAPGTGLCSAGKPTRVSGTGPWNWNCSGIDGGDTQDCTATRAPEPKHETPAAAPVAKVEKESKTASAKSEKATGAPEAVAKSVTTEKMDTSLCGTASELVAITAPDKDLCKQGSAGSVTGSGPWSWTCASEGHTSSCSTLSLTGSLAEAVKAPAPSKALSPGTMMPAPHAAPAAPVVVEEKAVCGSAAASLGVVKAPADELCSEGKPSATHGNGPWTWTCVKGKSRANCEVAKLIAGACGSANGSVQRSAPVSDLCSAGSATDVQGNGPWMWSCVGAGGGASISCSASAQSQTRVDGVCGVAANAPTNAAPNANLCDTGIASNVYGEGPWTWTCSGLNGGIASSCSAQRNIAPAPPPPGPPVNGLCGSSNGVAMLIQPLDDLCSSGTATGVSGNGPWNWNCLGENGGMTVSCTAPLQPPAPITGACGTASGVPATVSPRSGLCSAGISSAVSGQGPWTWSCSGTNGGGAVACVAPLAGSTGKVGSLPSLVTPSEAPTPLAAPSATVKSHNLVTPLLPSGKLPPLDTGTMMPQLQPSKSFETPPQPADIPPEPLSDEDADMPEKAPELPAGTKAVPPPPIRDTMKPSPALRSEDQGILLPGNRFELDANVSSLAFTAGSENIDPSATATLDRVALILMSNPGVRITLTAYADNTNSTPREARRLSLARALAVRDYLSAKGILTSRVDVRALGANVPSGNPDRVDIKAN